MKIRKYLDLVVASTIAILTLIITLIGFRQIGEFATLPGWFMPFGVLMVMVIPGYSLVINIFPPPGRSTILLLSLGLSMGLDFFGSVILNFMPHGLQPNSWAIWLSSITIIGCIAAALQRHFRKETPMDSITDGVSLSWSKVILFIMAFIIGAGAIALNFLSAKNTGMAFTQFWAIPVASAQPNTLEIGINNWETKAEFYNIYVESNGRELKTWDGIHVLNGEAWTTQLSLTEQPTRPIFLYLYRSSMPDKIYRSVKIEPEAFNAISPTSLITK
jgi:uncharacterized membrane protein